MPIHKKPIVHRFGIISNSHREALQQQLRDAAIREVEGTGSAIKAAPNPFEVSTDFVQNFNATNEQKRQGLLPMAFKMLDRIKKRVGLLTHAEGPSVNLAAGWVEAIHLAQCDNRQIFMSCVELLEKSCNEAPVQATDVQACLDVAEMLIFWLRANSVETDLLTDVDTRLIQTIQVVFCRLYAHNMACHLISREEILVRLAVHVQGSAVLTHKFKLYPTLWLGIRIFEAVGQMLTTGVPQEAVETLKTKTSQRAAEISMQTATDHQGSSEDPLVSFQNERSSRAAHRLAELKSAKSKTGADSTFCEDTHVSFSGALSEEAHELSPSLWHALDVYKAVLLDSSQTEQTLSGFRECQVLTNSENWIDEAMCISILGEASKFDVRVLGCLQGLLGCHREDVRTDGWEEDGRGRATPWHHWHNNRCGKEVYKGEIISPRKQAIADSNNQKAGFFMISEECQLFLVQVLRDICVQSPVSTIRRSALVGPDGGPNSLNEILTPKRARDRLKMCPINLTQLACLGLPCTINKQDLATTDFPFETAWKVRHSAVLALIHIKSKFSKDPMNDGFKLAAVGILEKLCQIEKDPRVLEAHSLAQTLFTTQTSQVNITSIAPPSSALKSINLIQRCATMLGRMYLPVDYQQITSSNQITVQQTNKKIPPPISKPRYEPKTKIDETNDDVSTFCHSARPKSAKPMNPLPRPRMSLAQELTVRKAFQPDVSSYVVRTSLDLHRLVEDQWRKQLHHEIEGESSSTRQTTARSTKAE